MPTRGTPSIETLLCLRENLDGYPNILLTAIRKPVVEACNDLFRQATELDVNRLPFDPIFMTLADDSWWAPGLIERAVSLLESNPEVDILTTVVSCREPNGRVVGVTLNGDSIQLLGHKPGEMIPLRYGNLHTAFIRPRVIRLLADCPAPFDMYSAIDSCVIDCETYRVTMPLTEDYAFLGRAAARGVKVATERTLIVGHVEPETGQVFMPNMDVRVSNGLEAPSAVRGTEFVAPKPRRYFQSDEIDVLAQELEIEKSDGSRMTVPFSHPLAVNTQKT